MNINLRQISIIDYALALVIIVGLVGGVYLFQQKRDSEDELADVEERLSRARVNLGELSDSDAIDTLTAQLDELQAAPDRRLFPSREEASNLFPAIAAGARDLSVNIINFNSSETTLLLASLGTVERPAISYVLSAEGDAEDLLGVLGLLDEYPTAVVRDLALEGKKGQWLMNLGLAVFYHVEAGEAGAPADGEQTEEG